MFQAKIIVSLKQSILDPQGSVVAKSLQSMDFDVSSVRIGKYMELVIQAADEAEAEQKVRLMCEKLLANTVTEEFDIQLQRVEG